MVQIKKISPILGAFLVVGAVFSNFMLGPQPLLFAAAPIEIAGESFELINVNMSNVDELQVVRGIGPKLADRIIAYRNEFGPFNSIDDLSNVHGIGGAKLQKIKQQIAV